MDVPPNASRWTKIKWATYAYLLLVVVYATVPFLLVWRLISVPFTSVKFVGEDFEKVFEDLSLENKLLIGMFVRQFGLKESYRYFRLPCWHPGMMTVVIYRGWLIRFSLKDNQNWMM